LNQKQFKNNLVKFKSSAVQLKDSAIQLNNVVQFKLSAVHKTVQFITVQLSSYYSAVQFIRKKK